MFVFNNQNIHNVDNMNIEHLKLFIRVASTHNISQAGKELGLSAAVASTYLNKLERDLGVLLIQRSTRSVSLTPEGISFLPHAEEVIQQVELARSSVGSGSVSPQGTLRIAASASFGRMHLVPKLDAFLTKYPDLTVDLRLSDSIIDLVEGGFDVAVRNSSLNDSSLIARKLAPDRRILCASPDYLREHGEPDSIEDLHNHSCIELTGIDTWTFNVGTTKKSIKIKGVLRVDNGETMRDACVAGIGISLCSVWCAYKEMRSGELVQVLTDFPLQTATDIWALYPSSRLLAPKVRAFIDYYLDVFEPTPYWEADLN